MAVDASTPESGLIGYLADHDEAQKRATKGPPRCECDEGPRVGAQLDDEERCQRCGRALRAHGRVVAAH